MEELKRVIKAVEEGIARTMPTPAHFLAAAVVAVVLVFGGIYLFLSSQPRELIYEPAPRQNKEVSAKRRSAKKPLIAVHVAGHVTRPQVYFLPEGTRVIEAVKAAGGPSPDADTDALNLAARVEDGQRLYVPAKGEALAGGPGDIQDPGGKLNVNSASQSDLETLDGIGPKLAERIIAYRQKVGGFKTTEQLQEVQGIGPKKLELFKDQITVR